MQSKTYEPRHDKSNKMTVCPAKTQISLVIYNVLQYSLSIHMSRLMTKPTKRHVRQAKTQISLGIRPVGSESSLSAWRNLGSLATQWGHSENSDQTGWMPRLIWVFAGRTVVLLVLSCRGSYMWNLPHLPRNEPKNSSWNVSLCTKLLKSPHLTRIFIYVLYILKLKENLPDACFKLFTFMQK